jgi:trk system potassium uptake protein TrkA
VAERLDRAGHEVTVISQDPEAFTRLPRTFRGRLEVGSGTDVDFLRRCGVPAADAFIALTDGDNTNIMASQIAKTVLGVRTVISQVKDPLREDVYKTLGIQTISPTRLGAERIRAAIDAA